MTDLIWQEIGKGLWDTLYVSVLSTLLAYAVGLPLGVVLAITDKNGLKVTDSSLVHLFRRTSQR